MNSGFIPLAGPGLPPVTARPARSAGVRKRAAARRAGGAPVLAWCVLAVSLLLELAIAVFPGALLLGSAQVSTALRQASGYPMLALLVFAMGFGWLRRRPAMARQHQRLNEVHQFGGLLVLLLLALHAAGRPAGFLACIFHAMTVGLAAGALRGVLGPKAGRRGATALLFAHIGLSCLVCAAVLLHLWFVYAYTG